MHNSYEIRIENKSTYPGRFYYAYGDRPLIIANENELHLRQINQHVLWKSSGSVADKAQVNLRYSSESFLGFIGLLKNERVEILKVEAVKLGTITGGGTSLLASCQIDGVGDEIEKTDTLASYGTFTIDCNTKGKPKSLYVVGLAIEVDGEPSAIASVEFDPSKKYIITPRPISSIITIRSGELKNLGVGHLLKDIYPASPSYQANFMDDDRPMTVKHVHNGAFEGPPQRTEDDSRGRRRPNPTPAGRRPTTSPQTGRAPRAETPPVERTHHRDDEFDRENELVEYDAISKFNKEELGGYWTEDQLETIAKQAKKWYKVINEIDELDAELLPKLLFLALYDHILLLDDSSSMRTEASGRRITEMKKICEKIVAVNQLFDNAQGVKIEFLNRTENLVAIKTPQNLQAYFAPRGFGGFTKLGTALKKKILDPLVLDLDPTTGGIKPRLISIITDGRPYGEAEDTLEKVLISCKDQLVNTKGYGKKTVVFQISQVGNDANAQKFLHNLERNARLKGIIDVTSNEDLEKGRAAIGKHELVKEERTVKMLAGALLTDFDDFHNEDWDPEKRAGNT